jgi:hypothetical protein
MVESAAKQRCCVGILPEHFYFPLDLNSRPDSVQVTQYGDAIESDEDSKSESGRAVKPGLAGDNARMGGNSKVGVIASVVEMAKSLCVCYMPQPQQCKCSRERSQISTDRHFN